MKQREIRFGDWSYLPDTLELCRGSVRQAVEPRVARLLEFLLEHPGELLSHDRLIEAVWDGRVVSDEAVRRAISALRRLLGTRDGSGIVRTIHKKGYIALFPPALDDEAALDSWPPPEEDELPEPELPARAPLLSRRRQDLALAALVALVCVLALALGPPLRERASADAASVQPQQSYSVAVLPFAVRNGPADEAIATQLRAELGLNPVFDVAPPAVTAQGERRDPRTVGQLLGVRYVLDGSIGHGGERMQIVARLFDSATGSAVWSGSYDRAPSELDALPQDIANDLARALKVVLVSSSGASSRRAPARI